MIYLLYMAMFLGVAVFKTSIVPQFPLFDGFYDIMLLFVIYVGFFRSIRESLVFIVIFGTIMDAISGGTFGLYTTSYLWQYAFVLWLTRFMRVTNNMILPLVVLCSVVIQNAIFLGSMTLLGTDAVLPPSSLRVVLVQALWGVFTGPILILLLRSAGQKLVKWQRRVQTDLG